MRINYRNTALKFLEDPKNMPIHTPDGYSKPLTKEQDYKLLYGLQNQFAQEGFSEVFSRNIQYITMPFYDAYRRAEARLKEVVLKTKIEDSGTLIIPHPQHTQTIFYRLKSKGDGSTKGLEAFIVMFTKHSKSDSYGLDLAVYLGMEDQEIMDVVWKGFADQGRDMAWWIADLMLFKTFLKYAEAETKIIAPNKKDYHIGVKYLNETDNKVQILDSSYFTSISRTEGFGVRGHFRFQPCGKEMSGRRLIWISDFQKTGYHRKAKILNQQ